MKVVSENGRERFIFDRYYNGMHLHLGLPSLLTGPGAIGVNRQSMVAHFGGMWWPSKLECRDEELGTTRYSTEFVGARYVGLVETTDPNSIGLIHCRLMDEVSRQDAFEKAGWAQRVYRVMRLNLIKRDWRFRTDMAPCEDEKIQFFIEGIDSYFTRDEANAKLEEAGGIYSVSMQVPSTDFARVPRWSVFAEKMLNFEVELAKSAPSLLSATAFSARWQKTKGS